MGPPPSPPPAYPYPAAYAMRPEGLLTRRGLWTLNLFAIAAVWLGLMLFVFGTTDRAVLQFARFLIVSGATFGALSCAAGALGSHRTSDYQNLGLLVLAAFWIFFLSQVAIKLI